MPGPNGEECGKCQCFFKIKSQIVGRIEGACKAHAPSFFIQKGNMSGFAYPSTLDKDWCIHDFKIKEDLKERH